MEDWLYEDGEDETKGVYVAKLEELKKVRNPRDQIIPCFPYPFDNKILWTVEIKVPHAHMSSSH